MEDAVKNDILAVLKEVIGLIKEERYEEIKELSNHTIHNASIFQDQDSVSIAVIIYSISKMIERSGKDPREIADRFSSLIKDATLLLEKNRIDEYETAIKKIFDSLLKADERLGTFIQEIIEQAEIKKGSKLYDHGISIARSAEVLGISQWDLMSYVGKTTITEAAPVDVKKRIEFARSLFRAG
jgi:AraC-like DNA-binding protein